MTRRLWIWAALGAPLGLPLALLVAFRAVPAIDVIYQNVEFHLLVVSCIAACALTVALLATRAAARSCQPGPVWLASGCIAVGILMLTHGLLTPGVLGTPVNRWVARTPYLAITLFAISLALAGRPRNSAPSWLARRHPRLVVGTPLVVLSLFGLTLYLEPTILWGRGPVSHENLALWILTVVDVVLLGSVAIVHWRRWRLGYDVVQYSLVLAATMSAAAVVSLRGGGPWRLSWWDYHGFLLAGFGAAVYAVLTRYRSARALEHVLASTFEHDPMLHIVEGYPAALRDLVHALEIKDAYTHGHSERTARTAVQLGLRLGVDEDTLRILARGGFLHDVGKIAISDTILNKPGPLTPDERAVIETHPAIGCELVSPVRKLREVLPAVLHHHERWDGTGYPHQLYGPTIPLVARIVALADVWDALTSDRAYRPGFPPDVALAHIVSARGSQFDPKLVDVFVAVAADWGYRLAAVRGDADEAWRAVESCHEALASRA